MTGDCSVPLYTKVQPGTNSKPLESLGTHLRALPYVASLCLLVLPESKEVTQQHHMTFYHVHRFVASGDQLANQERAKA